MREILQDPVHRKLIGARNSLKWKNAVNAGWYSAPVLVDNLLCWLGYAAEKGKLEREHYSRFAKTERSDILCELLNEARDALNYNRNLCNFKRSSVFRSDKERAIEGKIFSLTQEILYTKYGISDPLAERRKRKQKALDFIFHDIPEKVLDKIVTEYSGSLISPASANVMDKYRTLQFWAGRTERDI